jgi:hypothetical protein
MPTMKFLRTLEDVAKQDEERPIYLVAALPEWEHYDPDDCPAPIRAWVQQHYPDVVIEQLVADFESAYVLGDDSDIPDELLNELTPVFRLGFSAEQAKHFRLAWSSPPLEATGSPTNIYFLVFYDRPEELRAMGVVDHASVTTMPSGS